LNFDDLVGVWSGSHAFIANKNAKNDKGSHLYEGI